MTVDTYTLTVERIIDGRRVVGKRPVKPERLTGELLAEGYAPGTIVRLTVELDRLKA